MRSKRGIHCLKRTEHTLTLQLIMFPMVQKFDMYHSRLTYPQLDSWKVLLVHQAMDHYRMGLSSYQKICLMEISSFCLEAGNPTENPTEERGMMIMLITTLRHRASITLEEMWLLRHSWSTIKTMHILDKNEVIVHLSSQDLFNFCTGVNEKSDSRRLSDIKTANKKTIY